MKEKMEMIFTREEMKRVINGLQQNADMITVDLHGLKVKEAERFLKNLMAINREGRDICVIHGYNHGTAIKEMIAGNLSAPRLKAKRNVRGNFGRTVLCMDAA